MAGLQRYSEFPTRSVCANELNEAVPVHETINQKQDTKKSLEFYFRVMTLGAVLFPKKCTAHLWC
jgi:hypothetical protein